MSQVSVIVNNLKKYGFMYEDDIIEHFTTRGQVFDKGLMVARVKHINNNPQKYGFPPGMGIGSRPMVVNGYVKRIWTTVFLNMFHHVDARKAKNMKEFYTKGVVNEPSNTI